MYDYLKIIHRTVEKQAMKMGSDTDAHTYTVRLISAHQCLEVAALQIVAFLGNIGLRNKICEDPPTHALEVFPAPAAVGFVNVR